MSGNFLDKTIDFLFSKDERKWGIILFIIGFILRVLVGIRFRFAADEMVHGTHALGFISSGKLQIMDQSAIWFFLTDLFTKIFSSNVFGIRFPQILFGSLSIILIYLIGVEIFDKKAAIIASIIFAFSSFQLMQMRALMDISMTFFVLFSLYFLILFFKTEQNKFFFLTWIALGIAIMMKSIALWFIPPFVLFSLYYNKKTHNQFRIKQIIYAALIIILMVLPVLTFNYLLYKDKGILDLEFARFTKIGFETYKEIGQTIQPFSIKGLLISHSGGESGIIQAFQIFYRGEPLIVLILALIGIPFLIFGKNKFKWLLILSFIFPFIFLAGTSLLDNHFVFGSFYFSLFSSLALIKISDKIKNEKYKKIFIYSIIILIIIFSLAKVYGEAGGFFGQNELGKLISYKTKNIEPDSLVIADSRIYRGRIVFMFNDRHYLETNYFPTLLQGMDSLPGQAQPLTVYYIEAVTDDSGWGTVSQQPEFNKTNEDIVKYFEQNAKLIKTIYDIKGEKHFNIYKTSMMMKPSALNYADSTHIWFYYPVGYKPKGSNFDDYNTYTALDTLLNKLAYLILYLEVFTSIFLSFYLFYLLYKSS